MKNSPAQAITGHYMVHWGLPKQFHMQKTDSPPLAVVEFGPGRQWGPLKPLETMRFATNGMSAFDQGAGYRCELYVSARASAPWIIGFLAALARYPLEYQVRLCEGNTIPAVEPIHREKTSFTAFLIAEPWPEDAGTLGVISGVYSEYVFVHQVVAITQPEYEFALEHDGETLWNRLVRLDQPLLLDEARPDAVLGR